jgi:hypothetical protein
MPESTVVETVWTVKDQSAKTALERLNASSNRSAKALDTVKKRLHEHGEAGKKAAEGLGHAGRGAAELKEKLRDLGEHGSRAKEQLLELAAGVGIAVGLKSLAEKFIDLNSETENATRRMGAMISGLYTLGGAKDPTTNLRNGMSLAGDLMEEFGKKSMALGIPRSELAAMASSLAPAIAQTGKGTKDLVGLTSRLAVLARATGGSFEESAQAMTMAVRFGVAHRSPLMQMLGIHGQILAKMSAAQRLALIQKRISQFNPEELAKIRTYSDLVGRIKSQVEILTEEAGKPLFEAAKTVVQDLGKWIEKNRDAIRDTAKLVADKFVKYLHEGVELVRTIANHWEAAKTAVMGIATAWAAIKVGGELKGLAESFSSALSKSGSNFGEASGRAMGLAAKGVMLAEAAIIGYEIGKSINQWLEKQDWYKNDPYTKMMNTPAPSAAEDKAQLNDAIVAARGLVKDVVGLDAAMRYITADKSKNAGTAEWAQGLMKAAGRGDILVDAAGGGPAVQPRQQDVMKALKQIGLGDLLMARAPKEPPKPKEEMKQVAKTIQDFRYSQFEITQKFNENYDPDRIAVGFANTLGTLGERKLQSGFAPLGSTR